MDKNKTYLYYIPTTHTGQYSGINSDVPYNYEVSWIKSLYQRAEKICLSSQNLKF